MFVLVNFWRLLNRARLQIEEQMRWLQLHNHHGRKQPLFAYSLSLIFLDLLSFSVCESKNLSQQHFSVVKGGQQVCS